MPPRSTPSSIDRLPPEVRDSIAGLRRQGRTLDEILDHLKALDVEVSRSALGRHVKSLAEIGEDMRRADAMSRFIVERFGEETDDRVGRANMRILQGAIMGLVTARREGEDGEEVTLSAGEVKELSLALQRLTTSQRMDTERQIKLQREFAVKAAQAVKQAAGEKGLSAETADFIMQKVLGVGA
jgi:hypothetical protein